MIQDIYPHKLYNQYDPKAVAGPEDTVLNIVSGKILVRGDRYEANELVFPKVKELFDTVSGAVGAAVTGKGAAGAAVTGKEVAGAAAAGKEVAGASVTGKGAAGAAENEEEGAVSPHGLVYLFKVDDGNYYLLGRLLEGSEVPEGYIYVEDRSLRKEGMGPDEKLFAAITGKHLSDWYRDVCFCGRCGHKMVHSATERAMTCEACHYTAYPRIMPAVIVGVINGDSILLTKYRTGFGHNALIAGFTEIGETAEETVAREVMEEAGIRVKNIRYYKSQPWGSANDLLLGYYCEVDGDDTITMDTGELKYAEWVKREDIIPQPGNFSLTNEMMKRFKAGLPV